MRVKLKKVMPSSACVFSRAQRCGACNMAGVLTERGAVYNIFNISYERTYEHCYRTKWAIR